MPLPTTSMGNTQTAFQTSSSLDEAGAVVLGLLGDDECSEVIVNGPDDIVKRVRGERLRVPVAFPNVQAYHAFLNNHVMTRTGSADRIDGETMLVEGQMTIPSPSPNLPPSLARIHILAPPLVPIAKMTAAKKSRFDYSLDDLASNGMMNQQMAEFLRTAARGRLTVVISGPTGAGKSTLLQSMTHYFDPNERVIVIEETPELRLNTIPNTVYLPTTSPRPGQDPNTIVTMAWLIGQANRMRMDRILVGEIRSSAMADFLLAANSGADGSATTIHAQNPRRALDKMISLAQRHPDAGPDNVMRREIAQTVDIIIQANLIDGKNLITHIEEIGTHARDNGQIPTTTLFEYNRASGAHAAVSLPSQALQDTLLSRGIAVDRRLFAH